MKDYNTVYAPVDKLIVRTSTSNTTYSTHADDRRKLWLINLDLARKQLNWDLIDQVMEDMRKHTFSNL